MPNGTESVPVLLAMMICDQVITEEGTYKKTIVGTFDTLGTTGLPTTTKIGIYARLTDAEGDYVFRIRITHLDTDHALADMTTTPTHAGDRLGIVELAVNLVGLPIAVAGMYEFQLFANEVFIGRATMRVAVIQPPGQAAGG